MPDQVRLKRSLGVPLLTFYGVGNILGAGIYVLIGKVAGVAGFYAPLAFLVAALVAAFAAFTYAELSARYPFSAGEAVYLQEGLGRRWLSVTVGLLIALAGLVSAAAISRGFVGYIQIFISVPDWLVIITLVPALTALAIRGITQALGVIALITLVEVGGLVLILVVAGSAIDFNAIPQIDLVPSADAAIWSGILVGAFLAFYAFIGFEDMVNVAEEVKSPRRNMPRAIVAALVITTTFYILVALFAVLSVEPARLAQSDAPLALIYEQSTGNKPTIISVIAIFAVVNGALIQIIMVSRILYGMSRRRWLPLFLGEVHAVTQTPWAASLVAGGLVLAFALWLPLVTLAAVTSFIILIVFSLVNFALILIKRRDPHPDGVGTVPMWVPVMGLAASTGLLVVQLVIQASG